MAAITVTYPDARRSSLVFNMDVSLIGRVERGEGGYPASAAAALCDLQLPCLLCLLHPPPALLQSAATCNTVG